MLVCVGLVALLFSASPATSNKGSSSVLPEVWNEVATQFLEREGWNPGCRSCPKIRQILERQSQPIPEINMTAIRIEMAKQDILRKLGMEAPPSNKISFSSLPDPIAEGNAFNKFNDKTPPKKHTETLYQPGSDVSCTFDSKGVSLKMRFIMPEKFRRRELLSGKLWLYSNQCWLGKGTGLVTSKPCGSQATASIKAPISLATEGDWLQNDVTWMLQEKEECYSFKISWSSEVLSSFNCSHYLDPKKNPFLLLEVIGDNDGDGYRNKRNVDCSEGVTDCCREKLYISFADIGFSDFIYYPKGYDAYYCKGSCSNIATLSLVTWPYQSLIKKVLQKKSQELDISLCCAPTRLSPVELFYTDKNKTIVQQRVSNLAVETCGCM